MIRERGVRRAAPESRPISRPSGRTLGLSVALLVCLVPLLSLVPDLSSRRAGFHLPVVALAMAFVAAELLVFHAEIRHEATTFTFSEVPFVLGLFFASPADLILAHAFGTALILIVRERQPLLKVVFNISMLMVQCASAVVIFRALIGSHAVTDPMAWAIGATACLASHLTGISAVSTVIRWHGGRPKARRVFGIGLLASMMNTSLALAVAIMLESSPVSIVLLVLVTSTMYIGLRSYSALSRRYASLQMLYDFTKHVSGSLEPEQVLEKILSQARSLLRAEHADLSLFSRPRLSGTAAGRSDGARHYQTYLSETHRRRLVDERGAVVIGRGTKSPDERRFLESVGLRDCLIAPIIGGDRVIGSIMVADRLGDVSTFDGQDARLFETLANHASVSLENGRLIEELHDQARQREHEALHDALTGLPNRTLYQDRLAAAIDGGERHGAYVGVLLMDLNGFKDVNDTLGHHAGDLLLRDVARRLSDVVSSTTTVARLGGDEFALVMPSVSGPDEPMAAARRMQETLRIPHEIDGVSVEVGASVGVAIWPVHGTNAATLLQRADVAMYEAKSGGGDQVVLYDAGRDQHNLQRLALVGELRQAIGAGQLVVYFQPKIAFDDGALVGAEALVRWDHPERGLIMPDDFIPYAERSGLLGDVTNFVLSAALRQCRIWHYEGLHVPMAVNVSMQNLLDADLPVKVAESLRACGVEASWLTLEITESSVMAHETRTIGVLDQLAGLGVRLSIDDFGTGYSSLAYLQRLPVNEVKIDKSFASALNLDAGAHAIVRSVIDLARNLDLLVVAEGVEDQRTFEALRRLGADVAQGYHLGRPMPEQEFVAWAAGRPGSRVPRVPAATVVRSASVSSVPTP